MGFRNQNITHGIGLLKYKIFNNVQLLQLLKMVNNNNKCTRYATRACKLIELIYLRRNAMNDPEVQQIMQVSLLFKHGLFFLDETFFLFSKKSDV